MDSRRLYARIQISAATLELAALVDRQLAARMAAGGLSERRRAKSWSRIQSRRFYVRVLEPEMRAWLEDLRFRPAELEHAG